MDALLKNVAARAATPARWLIVLGMAYTLASTVLFIAAPQEAVSLQPESTVESVSQDEHPAADLESIVGANLFGDAGANQSVAAPAPASLVETRLPLTLHGVFVAETPDASTAILARKGRPEERFHIGDRVPGNATLDTVFLDHVLLRRGQSLERLNFPESDVNIAIPVARAEPAPAPAPNEPEPAPPAASRAPPEAVPEPRNAAELAPVEIAEQYREKLQADPQGTLEQLGLSPVAGGTPAGYRLDRLAQSPYLRQTGLKPGDLILSVNGQPVGDVGRDRLELDNVLAQGSARLEVQRGERRFFITASLK